MTEWILLTNSFYERILYAEKTFFKINYANLNDSTWRFLALRLRIRIGYVIFLCAAFKNFKNCPLFWGFLIFKKDIWYNFLSTSFLIDEISVTRSKGGLNFPSSYIDFNPESVTYFYYKPESRLELIQAAGGIIFKKRYFSDI